MKNANINIIYIKNININELMLIITLDNFVI